MKLPVKKGVIRDSQKEIESLGEAIKTLREITQELTPSKLTSAKYGEAMRHLALWDKEHGE